jgi:hypothetical protein
MENFDVIFFGKVVEQGAFPLLDKSWLNSKSSYIIIDNILKVGIF